jgi:hypothetical protein
MPGQMAKGNMDLVAVSLLIVIPTRHPFDSQANNLASTCVTMSTEVETKLPPTEVLNHVVDVHCHAQNRELPPEVMESLAITICTMAWCPRDQEVVADIARKWPDKVIPGFGMYKAYDIQSMTDGVDQDRVPSLGGTPSLNHPWSSSKQRRTLPFAIS